MANETLEQPATPERVGVGSKELLGYVRPFVVRHYEGSPYAYIKSGDHRQVAEFWEDSMANLVCELLNSYPNAADQRPAAKT